MGVLSPDSVSDHRGRCQVLFSVEISCQLLQTETLPVSWKHCPHLDGR